MVKFTPPPPPVLPVELPKRTPEVPTVKPKALPAPEVPVPLPPVGTKMKPLPDKQAGFIRSPTPVPLPPVVAPAPPPPLPKPIPAPQPPQRPPPPPQFRDELLTYEQIRRQEEERIQKHCRKITMIEQRERQIRRQDDQTLIRSVALAEAPAPQAPPKVQQKPIECKMVTKIIESPKPRNLEEAVSEFYRVHDESTRKVQTIVRQETRTQSLPPQKIPVVSVQQLNFPPPPPPRRSPEPVFHVEKRETHLLQEKRDFRSSSPLLLQETVYSVR